MKFNIWGWMISIFIILAVCAFWATFIYLSVNTVKFQGVSVEGFTSKTKFRPRSRSVELYNPSAYTGMFVRKFEVPEFYTRTNATFPLYNQLYVTRKYYTRGSNPELSIKNSITSPWNVHDVYPLQNRRLILV